VRDATIAITTINGEIAEIAEFVHNALPMTKMLKVLGITLLLGGLGHTVGVARLYLTSGVPEANRVMVDLWVAQAQFLAGGLYFSAARSTSAIAAWRPLASFGAMAAIGFALPSFVLLYFRAPAFFLTAPAVYLVASVVVLVRAVSSRNQQPNREVRLHAAAEGNVEN